MNAVVRGVSVAVGVGVLRAVVVVSWVVLLGAKGVVRVRGRRGGSVTVVTAMPRGGHRRWDRGGGGEGGSFSPVGGCRQSGAETRTRRSELLCQGANCRSILSRFFDTIMYLSAPIYLLQLP